MELSIINFGGGGAGVMQIPDSFAGRKLNKALLHQVVCANFANAREGNRAQKTRAEVSHTTRKLFRQKGSGRARAGMSSSPVRVGGGRAFPARADENFKQRIPRRMFRAAMAVMLAQLLREQRLLVADALTMESPKTAQLVKQLAALPVQGKLLLVDTEADEKLALSARNLPLVRYCLLPGLSPASLAAAGTVILSERAMRAGLEKWA